MVDIALFGGKKRELLRRFRPFKDGTPAHDHLGDILAVLPSAQTAAMLFWSLLASGQITMRKIDGWQGRGAPSASMPVDLAV